MNLQLNPTLDLNPIAQVRAGSAKSILVAQAYQEYHERRAMGELVDPDAFCQQFPGMGAALAKLIQAHLYLEENSFLLGDPSILEGSLFLPVGLGRTEWPALGATFLGFQLLEELGQGSFAKVFLAEEPKLGNRRVAVKVAVRGEAEANILGRVKHANIVPVYSIQEDKETSLTAVCMPFAGRATLGDVLDKVHAGGSVPARADVILETVRETISPDDVPTQTARPARVLQTGTYVDGIRFLGAQMADALAYMHELGICHRDLKPSNVLLNSAAVPMLLDFNLSTNIGDPSRLGGTLPYMAPEQLRAVAHQAGANPAALDGRADIFSLGVILYELLTGIHPFGPVELKTPGRELCKKLLERQQRGPAEIRDLNPDVDRGLADLIQRCLAHDLKQRPGSAELARLLWQGFAPLRRVSRWVARHTVAVTAAALLLVTTAVGAAYVASRLPTPHERRVAQAEALYKDGSYFEAVEKYTEAVELQPNNASTYLARARVYKHLGSLNPIHYDFAIDDYRHAQDLVPDGRNFAAMGYCFNKRFKRKEAKIRYELAIEAGFGTAVVANNLGLTLREMGSYTDAVKYLDQAIGMDSSLQPAFTNRALTYLADVEKLTNKEWQKATKVKNAALAEKKKVEILEKAKLGIADFETALKLGPATVRLYYEAACLCGYASRFDKQWAGRALSYLQEAMRLGGDPRHVDGRTTFAPLANEPDFQKIMRGPVPKEQPASSILLLDPIQDSPR